MSFTDKLTGFKKRPKLPPGLPGLPPPLGIPRGKRAREDSGGVSSLPVGRQPAAAAPWPDGTDRTGTPFQGPKGPALGFNFWMVTYPKVKRGTMPFAHPFVTNLPCPQGSPYGTALASSELQDLVVAELEARAKAKPWLDDERDVAKRGGSKPAVALYLASLGPHEVKKGLESAAFLRQCSTVPLRHGRSAHEPPKVGEVLSMREALLWRKSASLPPDRIKALPIDELVSSFPV